MITPAAFASHIITIGIPGGEAVGFQEVRYLCGRIDLVVGVLSKPVNNYTADPCVVLVRVETQLVCNSTKQAE
jgi:hypothetical protein